MKKPIKKYKCNYKRARTILEKHEVTSELFELWKKVPEQRLGQLLWNTFEGSLFHIEDYDLIGELKLWVKACTPKKRKPLAIKIRKVYIANDNSIG